MHACGRRKHFPSNQTLPPLAAGWPVVCRALCLLAIYSFQSLTIISACSFASQFHPVVMFRFLLVALLVGLSSAFNVPAVSKVGLRHVAVNMNEGGKGFGGGEATRDPEPTEVDPNDPKGKQQAIHKAESFAEYLAKRSAGQ